jgi:hypothetical protein
MPNILKVYQKQTALMYRMKQGRNDEHGKSTTYAQANNNINVFNIFCIHHEDECMMFAL